MGKDAIQIIFNKDGHADLYDDTYDITIHCESEEEQKKAMNQLKNFPRWIPVDEELPEEHDSMFAKYKGTSKWSTGMWVKGSDRMLVTVACKDGSSCTMNGRLKDGKWKVEAAWGKGEIEVIAWMPLPEPYKED